MASLEPIPGVEVDHINNQPILGVEVDDGEDNEEESPAQFSGFDRIQMNYEMLEQLVIDIQKFFGLSPSNVAGAPTAVAEMSDANSNNGSDPAPSPAGATTTPTTSNENISEANAAGDSSTVNGGDSGLAVAGGIILEADRFDRDALKKDVIHIRKNLEYIIKHLKELATSSYSERAEELLQYLMDAAEDIEAVDFHEDINNLKHLLHIFAKLKQWIPPQRDNAAEESRKNKSKRKKKGSPFVSKEDKVNAAAYIVEKLVSYDCKEWEMDGLLKSYGELKVRDKLCLLCFSVFLCDVDKVGEPGVLVQKNLVIKKKILIYWWVGEGLIHPNQPSPSPIPNSTTNTDPQNPDQVWPPREDEDMTIEKIGDKILNALRMKGFIEPVMKRGRESGSYQMLTFVHSFVTALAKKAGFFDFSKLDGTLTHRFGLSQRACLLKSQGNSPSSCSIWKRDIDNRTKLKKFATVQTLFNVNESIIDIKPEWFSKMKYLSVLHLGSWRSEDGEHIEVEDPKFMEELKNMKQLKLFSLQGVATIMKLPDSVCKLSNLIILDLRECHNLEELPANIGELKNLTHLDLTNCHLLTKLPIGISLLSKLEVFHWFVIYSQDGEKEAQKSCLSKAWNSTKGFVVHDLFRRDHKEVCALKDLLKLGNLRELSIVVNRNKFPSEYEVEVLMKMQELCTLKISWVHDIRENDLDEQTITRDGAAPVNSSSKCGSCFRSKKSEGEISHRRITQNSQNDLDEQTITRDGVAPVHPSSKCGSCFRSKKSEGEVSHRRITQNSQNDLDEQTITRDGVAPVHPSSKCGSCFRSKKSEGEVSHRRITQNSQNDLDEQTITRDGVAPVHPSSKCGSCFRSKKSEGEVSHRRITQNSQNDLDEQTITRDGVAPVNSSSKCGSCFRSKKPEGEVSQRRITQNTQHSESVGFIKLEKLELWCFPEVESPDWLVPSKLKELKKLYIKGGNLESLRVDGDGWYVETLRLKYMKRLKIEWRSLLTMFPHMTYLEKFQCPKLGLFPCDQEGVWLNEEKIAKPANPANPAV